MICGKKNWWKAARERQLMAWPVGVEGLLVLNWLKITRESVLINALQVIFVSIASVSI